MTIKLVKSLIGSKKDQIATAHALGLKKIGDTTTQPDNPQTRRLQKEQQENRQRSRLRLGKNLRQGSKGSKVPFRRQHPSRL